MEDLSNASLDCYTTSAGTAPFIPSTAPFVWHLASVDGVPPPLGSTAATATASRASGLGRQVPGGKGHPRYIPQHRDDRDHRENGFHTSGRVHDGRD